MAALSRTLVIASSLACLSLGSSCIFFVETDTAQCDNDRDCTSRGEDFRGTFCGESKVCVSNTEFCSTNAECRSRPGLSNNHICRKDTNRCVNLIATPYCPRYLGDDEDVLNDDAVYLGMHWISSWDPVTEVAEKSIEFARQEFKKIGQGGLPQVPGKTAGKRPIVWIICDTPIGEQALHQAATDHLIDTVGVPAIVGPLLPDWLSYAIPKGIQQNVAILTPDPSFEGLSDIPDRIGIFFSNDAPQGTTPRAQVKVVERDEAAFRAEGVTRELKLALLYPGTGVSAKDASTFYSTVRFNNGKTALQNGTNYKPFAYGTFGSPTFASTVAATVVDATAYQPDIVVCFGEGCTSLYIQLERARPNASRYTLAYQSRVPILQNFVGDDEERRKRVKGVIVGRSVDDPRVLEFAQNFTINIPETFYHPLAAQTYDLAYFLGYAVTAVGDKPLNGRAIGDAMLNRFVAGGAKRSANGSSMLPAFGNLAADQNIELDGVLSSGIFDKNTGFVIDQEVQVWCIGPDKDREDRFLDSGLVYKVDTDELTGTTTCFDSPPVATAASRRNAPVATSASRR
ncbi:MAG: hypothetical protein MUF34_04825 [Polyangiaceae bacterium]|jgi:hypothetical protein|nr:hypothetical protein [Polyangiaceae bacterium]